MQLLRIDCLGHELRLEGSMAGWQALFWNNQLVSQLDANANDDGQSVHQFVLVAESESGGESGDATSTDTATKRVDCQLSTELNWQPFELSYQLQVDGEVVGKSSLNEKDIETQEVTPREQAPRKIGFAGLASLGFKLLKSAKVIKVLFAAGSLAA